MRHKCWAGGVVLFAVLAAGCGPGRPTLAGGKPVNYWAAALRDPSSRVRKEAAAKLGNVGTTDPAALPALSAALNDSDAAVRREAIVGLVKCGPAARAVVPTLEQLRRNDCDPQVRAYAGQALERLRAAQ